MATRKTTTKTASKPATRTRKTKETSAPVPEKAGKPVFRLGTLVTLIVFIAVIGAAYYLTQNPINTDEAEATPTSEPISFFNTESVVTSIEVAPIEGETVRLERNEEKAWVLTQPTEAEADQGMAEAAASQVTSLTAQTEIEGEPSIFGLENPAFTFLIGFEDGTTGKLEVGSPTPTNNGYYVRVNGKMYITDLQGIDALTTLVDSPPYLSTPVPALEATPTP